jgi:hypothetical protein
MKKTMADANVQITKQSTPQVLIADASRKQGAEALRRAGDSADVAVQRAAGAASETMHRGMEAFAETQRQFIHTAAKQLEEISRTVTETAQGTTEDLRAFMTPANAASSGLDDLRQSMTGWVEGVVRINVQATQELLQAGNPSAFVEVQQRFVRGYLDLLMQSTTTFFRAARRTADDTLRPVEQQLASRRQANGSGKYQHAAE